MLTAFKNFLSKEWQTAHAVNRQRAFAGYLVGQSVCLAVAFERVDEFRCFIGFDFSTGNLGENVLRSDVRYSMNRKTKECGSPTQTAALVACVDEKRKSLHASLKRRANNGVRIDRWFEILAQFLQASADRAPGHSLEQSRFLMRESASGIDCRCSQVRG